MITHAHPHQLHRVIHSGENLYLLHQNLDLHSWHVTQSSELPEYTTFQIDEKLHIRNSFATSEGIAITGTRFHNGTVIFRKHDGEERRLVLRDWHVVLGGYEVVGSCIWLIGISKNNNRYAMMSVDFESLTGLILVLLETDSQLNKIACNKYGHTYTIGRTKKGHMLTRWDGPRIVWSFVLTSKHLKHISLHSITVDDKGYIYTGGDGVEHKRSAIRTGIWVKWNDRGEVVSEHLVRHDKGCKVVACSMLDNKKLVTLNKGTDGMGLLVIYGSTGAVDKQIVLQSDEKIHFTDLAIKSDTEYYVGGYTTEGYPKLLHIVNDGVNMHAKRVTLDILDNTGDDQPTCSG